MRLTRGEVLDALGAVLPVDIQMLEKALQGDLWQKWDPHMEGVGIQEFEDSKEGLLQWVLYKLPSARLERGKCPDLSSKETWFRYWDDDGVHSLSQKALKRAFVRTFKLDFNDIDSLQTLLTSVWQEFGLGERPVSRSLFCEEGGGLCDELLHHLRRAWGQEGLARRQRRATLLQMTVRELKQVLLAQTGGSAAFAECVEKEDMVQAIIGKSEQAGAAASPPVSPNGEKRFEALVTPAPAAVAPPSPLIQTVASPAAVVPPPPLIQTVASPSAVTVHEQAQSTLGQAMVAALSNVNSTPSAPFQGLQPGGTADEAELAAVEAKPPPPRVCHCRCQCSLM
jgi:hypothetical protein